MTTYSENLQHPLAIARQVLTGEKAWIVGGAVRDALLNHPTTDLDIVLAEHQVKRVACAFASKVRAAPFCLSEVFGSWRVVAHDHSWQVDFMPLTGEDLLADLARRDYTINAIAQPVAGGELIDPYNGQRDIAQKMLRVTNEQAIPDDPLRMLRALRLACELGFHIVEETHTLLLRHAEKILLTSSERVFAELKRILASPDPVRGVELGRKTGVFTAIFPELLALQGVGQNVYHHLDVYDHTVEVLKQLLAVEQRCPQVDEQANQWLAEYLRLPLAEGITRSTALRFSALFHDIAKPLVRASDQSGKITFFDHDQKGALLATRVLRRWRSSEQLQRYVAAVTRQHLALGFLVYQQPLTRHDVYSYLQRCDGVAVDVTLLSIADRLATKGKNAQEAIAKHLQLAGELFPELIEHAVHGFPKPLLSGSEIMESLSLPPGPRVGELIALLREAQFVREIKTPTEALRFLQTVK